MKSTSLICLLLSIISIEIPNSFADGGQVQLQQAAGSCVITLFTPSSTLRPEKTDFSVMVQDRESGDPVMNAGVKLSFRGENGSFVQSDAQRGVASNKLLYAAVVTLPAAGRWKVQIDVSRGQNFCSTAGELTVQSGKPVFSEHLLYFLIPPLVIAVFLLHQWLKIQQKSRQDVP
jgi:hypothetical protein